MVDASPWEILGLVEGASDVEIRRRWRVLVRSVHPDANPDGGDVEALDRYLAAYRQLSEFGGGEDDYTIPLVRPPLSTQRKWAAAPIVDDGDSETGTNGAEGVFDDSRSDTELNESMSSFFERPKRRSTGSRVPSGSAGTGAVGNGDPVPLHVRAGRGGGVRSDRRPSAGSTAPLAVLVATAGIALRMFVQSRVGMAWDAPLLLVVAAGGVAGVGLWLVTKSGSLEGPPRFGLAVAAVLCVSAMDGLVIVAVPLMSMGALGVAVTRSRSIDSRGMR